MNRAYRPIGVLRVRWHTPEGRTDRLWRPPDAARRGRAGGPGGHGGRGAHHGDGLRGRAIIPGEARGAALVSRELLFFWSGYDPATGDIVDCCHPLSGANAAGAILAVLLSRGSSTTTAILLEAIRAGTVPAAILTTGADFFFALASVVADELCAAPLPLCALAGADFARLHSGAAIHLTAAGVVEVELGSRALDIAPSSCYIRGRRHAAADLPRWSRSPWELDGNRALSSALPHLPPCLAGLERRAAMSRHMLRVVFFLMFLVLLCLGGAPAVPVSGGEPAAPFLMVFPATAGGPEAPQAILTIAMDAGYHHSCLINAAHEVLCWGANESGQLGNGSTVSSSSPVRVVSLSEGAVAVSAGGAHTCVVTTQGAAKCWGAGGSGQLGDGKGTSSSRPVAVSGLSGGVVDISAGYAHTCAVLDSGAARCWGAGGKGQLGNGAGSSSGVPVTPTGLTTNVAQIGAGEEHTCARMVGGGIKCWGDNYYGQLATGNRNFSLTPVNTVAMGGAAAQLAAGTFGNCIRTAGGGVQCWGFRAIVGDGTNVCYNGVGSAGDPWVTSPRWIANMTSGVTDVAVGNAHACSVKDGGAWCWGDGREGQLGNGQTPTLEVCTPVGVTGLSSGVVRVSAGKFHTLALMGGGGSAAGIRADDLGVRAWGKNDQGQLGDGTTARATTPVQVIPPAVRVYLPLAVR